MKKAVIKGMVFIATFFVALFTISAIVNQGNTDMTVEMEPATFPLVYMEIEGQQVNCLHGYWEQMNSSNLRDTITPFGEERSLSMNIRKFGTGVKKVSFEVRSIDGSRLIENTEIKDYEEDKEYIYCDFTVKDLIEENEEYMLVILLETENGDTIRYYTRIIQAADYHTIEKLNFVKDFHERSFDKEAAKEITKYLESNAEGDNSSFSRVDIHSNFNQITWGNLKPERIGNEIIDIKEIGPQTATFKISYAVKMQEGKEERVYRIEEFYRVRYTTDRMYLLDYERTMNQFLNEKNDIFTANKISLGIMQPDIEIVESDGGNVFAFVAEDRLYCYNVTDNKFAVLYGFYDAQHFDERTIYNAHDIKILGVDETGNVTFLVYGYMNRGRHEGEVGVQVFRYSSLLNTIEEEVFLPYHDSYDILRADVEKLSYVNKSDVLYLMLEGTVYAVTLQTKEYEVIVSNLSEEQFKVSDSNRMLAWQVGKSAYDAEKLCLMNLNTGKVSTIEAGTGKYVAPLGFMEEDLIYGIARQTDVVKDSSGRVIFPMKTIRIENENNEVLKTYEQDGIFVTDCEIEKNQITLKRVRKIEEPEGYESVEDDQIMNNEVTEEGSNVLETAVTEKYETVVQIAAKNQINVMNMKIQTPREVLFEGGREIILENEGSTLTRYYVYGKDGVIGIYTDPASAIHEADFVAGVVTTDKGYIWKKGNRNIKNQIMAIEGSVVTEQKNSLAVCLDTILKYEGISRNTEQMLKGGAGAMTVLKQQMPDAEVMDLTGCSLDAVLYYVDQDIPVLAMLEDNNAVLLVGFNELNTVWMDPQTGSVYKKGMNDSREAFERAGNRFITYIR
ncbi:MAG: hypothetical protein GX234_11675 [Clostridiales bacterium]|nr:hypothetical protein [Clostridiales bacterium]